jgi:GNAT superfamily N-acetyltransferase
LSGYPDGPVVRRDRPADSEAVADVRLRSFAVALPTVRAAHTDAETREWVRNVVIADQDTWVVCLGGRIVGMMSIAGGDIDQLYLDPAHRGRGLGRILVNQAKMLRPGGLGLWTFQVNGPAIRFYRRNGFVETQRTDGSGNEEREPDVRMEWHPVCDKELS